MNCYLISFAGKQYATEGESQLDAELKFIERFEQDTETEDFKIKEVEVDTIKDDQSIYWF